MRTDEPAPPSATWLGPWWSRWCRPQVEPRSRRREETEGRRVMPFADERAPTDIAPAPVASVLEPNTKASSPLAVELYGRPPLPARRSPPTHRR